MLLTNFHHFASDVFIHRYTPPTLSITKCKEGITNQELITKRLRRYLKTKDTYSIKCFIANYKSMALWRPGLSGTHKALTICGFVWAQSVLANNLGPLLCIGPLLLASSDWAHTKPKIFNALCVPVKPFGLFVMLCII